jgi:hypothetical protein
VTALGDDDRELPQRVRGAARAGPAPPAKPVLSEELRERIRAAVQAERGEAVGQDQELASEPERRASRPTHGNAATPATNGVDRAIESEHAVEPAAPERTGAAVEPGPATAPIKPGRTVTSVKPVEREPTAKPKPADGAPANHKPAAVQSADLSARLRQKPVRRHPATARMAVVAVAIIAGGLSGFGLSRSSAKSHTDNDAPARGLQVQEAAARHLAADWVAQQVNHSTVVSCDKVTCTALAAAGFPARNLLLLGPGSSYPVTSAVVVVTTAVRDLFGTSLSSNWAPAVLATFGSGDAQITIRVIASNGTAAYQSALSADLAARKATAAALLQANVITVSATARKQLIAGQVDSRLLLAIAALAAKEPVDIIQFGNIGPGADADIPLRYADLTENDQAAHLADSAYVRSIRADLGAVPAGYRPASIATVVLRGGQAVLRIEFTAPSPLGLLGPQGAH